MPVLTELTPILCISPMQEAFFGKTLLDQSKKALLVPPGQRNPQGLLRHPLSGKGSRPLPLEPGKHIHIHKYN